jgi:hypothetical protein
MTTSSFPPIDDLIRQAQQIDWRRLALRGYSALIAAMAWAYVAGILTRRLWNHLAPQLAALFRQLAALTEGPVQSPLIEWLTAGEDAAPFAVACPPKPPATPPRPVQAPGKRRADFIRHVNGF